jgi:hypothetical protein
MTPPPCRVVNCNHPSRSVHLEPRPPSLLLQLQSPFRVPHSSRVVCAMAESFFDSMNLEVWSEFQPKG